MNLQTAQDGKTSVHRKKRFTLSPESSPVLYLLPAVIFMLIMVAYPIGRIFYLSMTQDILTRPDLPFGFIGLQNFISLFHSADFWQTLLRTAGWAGISVTGKCVFGFIIAWLLSKDIAFKKFYVFLLLIPWVTPMVVAAVAWSWVYNGQNGMLNWVLMNFHVISTQYSWLGHKASAFIATAVVDMWIGIPFMGMVFLAGLQSVPEEVLESAEIDGASSFHKLFYIILPLMRPVILVSTTLSAIWTFNSFGVIWPMTKGGPVNSTETLVVEAYQQSFGSFNIGMGAAVAVVIFFILLIFTIAYKRLLMKQEEA